MKINRNLVLGGAQFGVGYGKFIHSPKLSHEDLTEILLFAKQKGITEIDLAQNYHEAAQNLADSNLSSEFIYSTKIAYSLESENEIISNLIAELNLLKVDDFRCVLIHNWGTLCQEARVMSIKFLKVLVSEGLCKEVGVSIYEVNEIDFGKWVPNCIQAPLNFFNRDFLTSKVPLNLAAEGTTFAARSIFHQGLLLNPHLSSDLPELMIFHDFCFENNFTYLEGALAIFDTQSLFTSLILGISNANQLEQIVKTPKTFRDLDTYPIIKSVSSNFTDPRKW